MVLSLLVSENENTPSSDSIRTLEQQTQLQCVCINEQPSTDFDESIIHSPNNPNSISSQLAQLCAQTGNEGHLFVIDSGLSSQTALISGWVKWVKTSSARNVCYIPIDSPKGQIELNSVAHDNLANEVEQRDLFPLAAVAIPKHIIFNLSLIDAESMLDFLFQILMLQIASKQQLTAYPSPISGKELSQVLDTCTISSRSFAQFKTFWAKTFLYALTDGGWGYYRILKSFQDPNYEHERDKHEVRHKHTGSSGWQAAVAQTTPRYRDYASYEEYRVHQQQKWDEMLKLKGGFEPDVVGMYRRKFFHRFRWLLKLLPLDAEILCAGARQGTEVEVLRDIGFKNAWGTDLNPGPFNPWVAVGDFMNFDLPDSSVDFLYCNAVDHAFELDKFFREHSRVLKPKAYAIYDIAQDQGSGGGGAFEAVEWSSLDQLLKTTEPYFNKPIRRGMSFGWNWYLLSNNK